MGPGVAMTACSRALEAVHRVDDDPGTGRFLHPHDGGPVTARSTIRTAVDSLTIEAHIKWPVAGSSQLRILQFVIISLELLVRTPSSIYRYSNAQAVQSQSQRNAGTLKGKR